MLFLRRASRTIVIAYALYVAVSLLLIMPALNVFTPGLVEQATGRRLDSELIVFNPFNLSLSMRGAVLHEPANTGADETFARLRLLQVNLGLQSLWRRHVTLDAFVIQGLELQLVRQGDGTLNISDLIAPPDQEKDPDEAPFAISIDRIDIDAAELRFQDRMQQPAYTTNLRNIRLDLAGLSTVGTGGSPYDLLLETEYSGVLHWRGELSLPAGTSAGSLQAANLDLRPLYQFFAPQLPFDVPSATLDISGDYTAGWDSEPEFTIRKGAVQLRDLRVQPKRLEELPNTHLGLAGLLMNDIAIDSASQAITIGSVELTTPQIAGFSDGKRISLLELAPAAGPVDAAAATSPAADSTDGASGWSVALTQLRLVDGEVQWRSELLAPEVLALAPIALEASDLRWPAVAGSPFAVSAALNGEAQLGVEGILDIGSGDGNATYRLSALPISWLNPLLDSFVAAKVASGSFSTSGAVKMVAFAPERIDVNTQIDDFSVVLQGRERADSSWQQLDIRNLVVEPGSQTVDLGEIVLRAYRGSLLILPDGRLNAQLAVREQPAVASPRLQDSTEATPDSEEQAWRIGLQKVQLVDARVDFQDESLPLPFRTVIQEINGSSGALAPAGDVPMSLDFAGSVDGYAPVSISGSIAPFASERSLDIKVTFQGVDIANLTPYSGTYAGYQIDSGTLNLALRYQLDGDRLRGENRAIISSMALGDRVDSPKALDLPLQLALALLTDAQGVIDLDIPISGSVDSPDFSLGKVIGRALGNIITKAVTAPFRLLAGLVGSKQDLQEIPFPAAMETLAVDGSARLDALATALQQRPQLRLLVAGSLEPASDLPALRMQQLDAALLAQGLSQNDLDRRSAAWADAIGARYGALGQPPADNPPTLEEQLQQVLASYAIPEARQRELANARGAAVKRYLVTARGIAADRVTLNTAATKAGAYQGARLDLDG